MPPNSKHAARRAGHSEKPESTTFDRARGFALGRWLRGRVHACSVASTRGDRAGCMSGFQPVQCACTGSGVTMHPPCPSNSTDSAVSGSTQKRKSASFYFRRNVECVFVVLRAALRYGLISRRCLRGPPSLRHVSRRGRPLSPMGARPILPENAEGFPMVWSALERFLQSSHKPLHAAALEVFFAPGDASPRVSVANRVEFGIKPSAPEFIAYWHTV